MPEVARKSNQLVSIVIPTFNRSYCLAKTIESVLSQSYANFEIILIDDGSTDDTKSLISSRFQDEKRIQYFYQSNQGVSSARNFGFSKVNGSYVALLDSDDLWKPWKLEAQVRCLENLPDAGMVWTDMEAVDPEGVVLCPKYLRSMYRAYQWFPLSKLFAHSMRMSELQTPIPVEVSHTSVYTGTIYSQMIMGNLVHTSTVLLTRSRLEAVGGFNESLQYAGEDYEFHLRTCQIGPVAFLDQSSISYTRGLADQLTRDEYKIYMARNFRTTVLDAIEANRDQIFLPRRMLNIVQAKAHSWVAEAELNNGNNQTARLSFRQSLSFRLWQPRAWLLFFASCLSPKNSSRLRGWYRMLRNLIGFHGRRS